LPDRQQAGPDIAATLAVKDGMLKKGACKL